MKHTCYTGILAVMLLGCSPKDQAKLISSDQASAESVYLTRDQDDNPVIVWTEKENDKLTLFFAAFNGGSRTFSERNEVPLTADVATHPESMPKVAFKNDGTIIVAYEKKAPTKQNKYGSAIYYVMSADGGNSWTGETFLHADTVAGKSRSYFDIERLPNGEVGASWLDIKLNEETGGRSVRFAQTTQAKGFGNEVLIDSSACQCCRIDVYTDDTQNIFVAYRGLAKGPLGKQVRDMMIATSTDGGGTFSTPVVISADNWNIDGCPHTGPSLCSNKAGLISLWYTEGSGTGIYYAQRADNSAPFTQRERVSVNGHHPQLCANGDRIAMLWEENTGAAGDQKTVIHYRIVKGALDIENNTLTASDVNAFLPVVVQTKTSFLVAYLMERQNKLGVYWAEL